MLVDINGNPFYQPVLGEFVILRSKTGQPPWETLKRPDVPEWVQEPDNMRRLVYGEMCQGDSDPYWYIAVKIADNKDTIH